MLRRVITVVVDDATLAAGVRKVAQARDWVVGDDDLAAVDVVVTDARSTDAIHARLTALDERPLLVRVVAEGEDVEAAFAHADDVIFSPLDERALEARLIGLEKRALSRRRHRGDAARARAVLDAAPDAMLVVDGNGRIVDANAQALRMFGYERETLVGLGVDALVPDAVRGRHAGLRGGYLQTPHTRAMGRAAPLHARRKDGSHLPVDVSLAPLETEQGRMVITTIRDLTERRLIEQDHAVTMRSIADAVLATDAEGRVTRMNPVAEQLTGFTTDVARGQPLRAIFRVIDETTRQPVEDPATRVLREGVIVAPATPTLLVARNGRELPIKDRAAPIRDDDGRVVGTVMVFHDVTEERQAHARDALTQRLVSIGTLAAGAAHEINNPLSIVVANLGIARESVEELAAPGVTVRQARETIDSLRNALEDASSGAERVAAIVRDLRTFSRGDDGVQELVQPREVLSSALTVALGEVLPRARLVRELGQVPRVRANGSRLAQVFLNLLLNAAHAIEGSPAANEVRVVLRASHDQVIVEVHDTGRGIPPEVRTRIFDPFFTTKPIGSGVGLGLSVCHGIVRSLGGELTCDSELGRGSIFRVSLPVASPVAR